MAALISVFIAVTLSLLVTRIAAEALTLTGLSRTSASFQARSAVLVRVPLRLTPNGTSVPSSCSRMTLLPLEAVGRTALLVLVLPLQNQSL